jgi:hypothetical protein
LRKNSARKISLHLDKIAQAAQSLVGEDEHAALEKAASLKHVQFAHIDSIVIRGKGEGEEERERGGEFLLLARVVTLPTKNV